MSNQKQIKVALTQMAALRIGAPDNETLELFSAELSKHHVDDVIAALEIIQGWPPEESDLDGIPNLGKILKVVAACRTVLVGYECPQCGYRSCGYVAPNDRSARFCRRDGAMLNEIHRSAK